MQRTLLTLALVAAAGAAVAQTTDVPVTPPSTSQDNNTANAGGHPTGQAAIAQKRIESDGYKNVQGLALGSDGLWHGRAMRGSAEVQVTVDKQGNVTQQ
jgi:hypothetical protein